MEVVRSILFASFLIWGIQRCLCFVAVAGLTVNFLPYQKLALARQNIPMKICLHSDPFLFVKFEVPSRVILSCAKRNTQDKEKQASQNLEKIRRKGFEAAIQGQCEVASDHLKEYLEQVDFPDPSAWNCRGAMLSQLEEWKAAKLCFQSAIECAQIVEDLEAEANAHFNLGNIFNSCGELDNAILSFQAVLEISPHDTQALNNLGIVLSEKGEKQMALEAFSSAVKEDPTNSLSLINQGNTLADLGHHVDAVLSYEEASQKGAVQDCSFLLNLGIAARRAGMNAIAGKALKGVLKLEPSHVLAKRLLMTIQKAEGGIAAGKGMSAEENAEYAAALFDGYSENFENDLTQELQYQVPDKLLSLLLRAQTSDSKKRDERFGGGAIWKTVVDIGCGSGLFGEVVRDHCTRLIGVDASSKMIEVAREKAIYDELDQGELVAFLNGISSGERSVDSVDAVVACDVFCYLSDLRPAIESAAATLRGRRGVLAFSTEDIEEISMATRKEGGKEVWQMAKEESKQHNNDELHARKEPNWELKETGRYGHSVTFVCQAIRAAGMEVQSESQQTLRMNGGEAIIGRLWLASFPD